MWLGRRDVHITHLAGLALHFDGHRRATDLAILNGAVITLGGIRRGGDGLTTMGALNLDFDQHGMTVAGQGTGCQSRLREGLKNI